ncbi:MAG: hypothetical protein EXR93_07145 [Gemmatimonadetes bacterium]|nr:hypothetical protein [Gemmatimonadota bacterium]
MTDNSPFDHRPDPELGDWLRGALSIPDEPAFVARVMAQVPAHMARENWLDILGDWARPGLAAAAVLVMLAGFWLGRIVTNPQGDDAIVASAGEFDPDTLLTTPDLPQVDVNLVMVYEYERQP